MQGILQAILDVTGVGAALVFDSSGSLVSHRGHAIYDQALCEQLTSSLLKAIDALQLEQEDWESVSARYADGRLLLRNLGTAGGGTHVLAVAADATLNLSFATVAIRVAANKLRRALGVVAASVPSAAPPPAAASSTLLAGSSQFAGSSSRFGGSSALPAGSSQFAGSSALPAGSSALPAGSSALPAGSSVLSAGSSALPAGSSVMPAGSSVLPAGSSVLPASSRPADSRPALAGSSSLSWSQTSSIGFSRIAVADPASSTFLSRSAKELARHVGPMAKVYVEEAVRRVSPDAPFSVSLGAKFLDDLAGQIEDNDDRTRFRQALALAMQVPPADHPQWIELVRGKVQFKPSFLAARMFVASARMEVGKRGANPELIRKYAAGLRELFAENADSSNVRQDLAKIFG
jgi:predicted regulator of Ras-like GTPase activity (Roadblock/LC7/MglB family)